MSILCLNFPDVIFDGSNTKNKNLSFLLSDGNLSPRCQRLGECLTNDG